jgi:LysM repeat protein
MTGGRFLRKGTLAVITMLSLAMLVSACGLIGKDKGNADGASVRGVVFSAGTNAQGQAVTSSYFAPNTPQITATVVMENAKPGMKVKAAWYQLGVANAGPDGAKINESEVTLTSDVIQDGRATPSFIQRQGGSGFPEDTWLLRVYVNDELVRTSGFIITRAAQVAASPQAPAAPPAPQTYTVVSGDTLQSVAQKFLPPGGNLQTYLAQLASANNISTTATLTAGQVLKLP